VSREYEYADTPLYWRYWGKAEVLPSGNIDYHLLPFHCLDVVAVADVWLQKSAVLLSQMSLQLGVTHQECRKIVLFFVSLHDLGKFDARFQEFVPALRLQLQGKGLEVDKEPYSHGSYGYWHFRREFFDSEAMKAVAGHHGFCDTSIRFLEPDADEELIEQDQFARQQWVEFCLEWLELTEIPNVGELSLLAGLCSVSDWIGSSMTNFSKDPTANLHGYYDLALVRAEQALAETGMLAHIEGAGFDFLFPSYQPRGIQCLLGDLALQPGLTIVESDTGSGKTEFALAYASSLMHSGLADGVVFGLPTQATANGLFDRIGEAAGQLFSDSIVTLAHGKAKYNSKYLIPDDNGFLTQSNKRAFLGSMSVATVDQILMGVLPIRHQFVRSFGTRKSVLILDEIHSFDAYMSALVERVLKGQHEAFSSVILLSATLPQSSKSALLSSYGGNSSSKQYPLVTQVGLDGTTTELSTTDTLQAKPVNSELWYSRNLLPDDAQCRRLIDWAEHGAMVAVVCNTVQDAQLLYTVLNKQTTLTVDLFHARYTVSDRLGIERFVLDKYGKNAPRSGGLLIATQVIEQSLDLDFDVLVSQIAPVEFLLQRMGRLWRHERHTDGDGLARRTTTIAAPVFITICPDITSSSVDISNVYGGSAYVYPNIRALYRSQQFVLNHSVLVFPDCYRQALDFVYQEDSYEAEPEQLASLAERYANDEDGRYYAAKQLSIQQSKPLNDVDPRAALLTRDGEMSRSVVLLSAPNTLLHGGDYAEQYDRELNTVSLSRKQTKGSLDEQNYCYRAVVGRDIHYDERGVFDERLAQTLTLFNKE
jgi:CRISPR-associated endonuclease/helicase Cas3